MRSSLKFFLACLLACTLIIMSPTGFYEAVAQLRNQAPTNPGAGAIQARLGAAPLGWAILGQGIRLSSVNLSPLSLSAGNSSNIGSLRTEAPAAWTGQQALAASAGATYAQPVAQTFPYALPAALPTVIPFAFIPNATVAAAQANSALAATAPNSVAHPSLDGLKTLERRIGNAGQAQMAALNGAYDLRRQRPGSSPLGLVIRARSSSSKSGSGDAAPVAGKGRPLEHYAKQIEKAIARKGQYTHDVISAALRAVAEQHGTAAADALVDKYNLTKLYGIPKAGADPDKTENDLGELGNPGETLGGKNFRLNPGDTLRFVTRENQIRGLGRIEVLPSGSLKIERTPLERPSRMGATIRVAYAITVPKDSRIAAITVRTKGNHQTRNDPTWAFSFTVQTIDPSLPKGAAGQLASRREIDEFRIKSREAIRKLGGVGLGVGWADDGRPALFVTFHPEVPEEAEGALKEELYRRFPKIEEWNRQGQVVFRKQLGPAQLQKKGERGLRIEATPTDPLEGSAQELLKNLRGFTFGAQVMVRVQKGKLAVRFPTVADFESAKYLFIKIGGKVYYHSVEIQLLPRSLSQRIPSSPTRKYTTIPVPRPRVRSPFKPASAHGVQARSASRATQVSQLRKGDKAMVINRGPGSIETFEEYTVDRVSKDKIWVEGLDNPFERATGAYVDNGLFPGMSMHLAPIPSEGIPANHD